VQKELNCNRVEAIRECVRRAKKNNDGGIEIEVESFDEALVAAEEKPDMILLDNMKVSDMKKVAEKLKGSGIILEASGGITPKNIKGVEKTGVDIVSCGYITHSCKPLDMALEVLK
jgi:nicotinate-nucleotide pyrophosphorylase (carboxylating)